jgi:hypothetical protein
VKIVTLRFPLLLFLALSSSLAEQERPVPPSRQELKNYQTTHPDVPPPQASQSKSDPAQMQREAADLAGLAQSVPSDIDSVTKGKLPKDVLDKLKRIEKISKHLRGELVP